MRRIGIDVGGTNTDAVLMDGQSVLSSIKVSTTEDIGSGIETALDRLLVNSGAASGSIQAVMIGTTQFLNAVVEAQRLQRTAVIRLGLPATASLPPLVDWPADLRFALQPQIHLCSGGHEFDGRPISRLSRDEIQRAGEAIAAAGISSIAVTSVFATVNSEMELEAASILEELEVGFSISLSHEIGRVGLLERENATVLNASLRRLATHVVEGFRRAVLAVGIEAPIYVSQNDGTLMDLGTAERYPVATFASGPTNSMRGASFLSGVTDCIVIDVGGTTTDVGVLSNSFPREASSAVTINGVRTNFRMPDVWTFGLGGGTRVRLSPVLDVGPDSVGAALVSEALVFGGQTLTTTDIAVASGRASIGDTSAVNRIPGEIVQRVLAEVDSRIDDAIDRVRISGIEVPIVLVGGGSVLAGGTIAGGKPLRPNHFEVANAVGAAIAQIGGEVDRVVAMEPGSRQRRLDEARSEAEAKAIAAGAAPGTVRIVDVEEVALPYVPGGATRLRVKAVGELRLQLRTQSGTRVPSESEGTR